MRLAALALACLCAAPAAASDCFQIADAGPRAIRASLAPDEAGIAFVGHASFRIESPRGVTAVTDFAGWWGEGDAPEIVTMNKAHSTHWTPRPDPAIAHVLRGWDDANPDGAEHYLQVDDMVVRNVPTDIRREWDGPGSGSVEPNANSIFVFEVSDLCIGHLGHLHHEPTDAHYGAIGRLDVVMVPVDGGFTMNQDAMIRVMRRLKARVVIPMHWFGPANLERFLTGMAGDFDVRRAGTDRVVLARDRLPDRPTVLVLDGR
jgi:L-ascorbate metabolism protein UlaG (beta-lactamase superfamily)